ncbi:tyrosine-protein phosphatase [Halobacillus yeomjeoni]|nr:CpsB/CapC family capsule biosynthesis tyrosine phosphatase [Halobacillus yeomjeoni]
MDDGPETMEESISMARAAAVDGVDKIIATPSHLHPEYRNPKNEILKKVKELNDSIKAEGISIEVLPGQLVRLGPEVKEAFENNDILPIDQDSGYVLVDLPPHKVPADAVSIVQEMQSSGYKMIVANPESHSSLQKNPNILYELVKNGAITQISSGSLTGKNGKSVQDFAFRLIESNLAHVIASGTQGAKKRRVSLSGALQKIEKKYGTGLMYQFSENAHFIINGEMVYTDRPSMIRSKKLWGIF